MIVDERIFEIRVTVGDSSERCFIDALSGEIRERESVPLPNLKTWRDKLNTLQSSLALAAETRRTAESPSAGIIQRAISPRRNNLQVIEEIGEELFNFIFVKRIFSAFDKISELVQRGHPVRIRLCVEHPRLAHLPWETMFDPKSKHYLASNPRTPFVRAAQPDELTLEPQAGPLCILGMSPENYGVDDLDSFREKENIKRELGKLVKKKQVILKWMQNGSVSALMDHMGSPPQGGESWHVFHFIGHGGYDENEESGYILLNADNVTGNNRQSMGGMCALYANDLRDVLGISLGMRLVVLNSCKGAATEEGTMFNGTAQKLILEGFPAVIAMQFEISDDAAITFSSELYRQLAKGTPIHLAVTLARLKLKIESPEWITPVLYMRTRDGSIFRDVTSA